MIYAAPGATFEATTSGAPTGLTGTIGVQVLDNVGGAAVPRTTVGIIESPAGSGLYSVTLTAPATAGQYTILWDQGVISPTTTAADDLIVTSSTPGGALPSGSDLTTVAAVREYLQKKASDTAQDGVIQALITRASSLIMRRTGVEFRPAVTGQARVFNYGGSGLVYVAPAVLRAVSLVELDPNGTPITLGATDYRLRSTSSSAYYRRLQLWQGRSYPGRFGFGEVRITGDWGYTAIPPEIEQACIVTVALWMRRDVQAFSSTFNLDEGRLERPEAVPAAVVGMLDPWMPAPTV